MSWLDTLMGRERRLRSAQPLDAVSANTPEEAAAFCLNLLVSLLQAEAGHAYLLSPAHGQNRLVSSFAEPGRGESAPPVLDPADIPEEPALTERAGERWLTVACGRALTMRVRLRRGASVPPDLPQRCRHFVPAAAALVETARQLHEARQEADQLKTVLAASRLAGDVALKPHRALELLFHLPLRLLGAADGGLVLKGESGDGPSLVAATDRGSLLTVKVMNAAVPQLLTMPDRPDFLAGPALGALRSEGVQAVVRVPVLLPGEGRRVAGCAYYFLHDDLPIPAPRMAALMLLAGQLGRVAHAEAHTVQTTDLYLGTLRSLVEALDGAATYTVGHSQRIAAYARITAVELGLPAAQADAIALGAVLHDVGMIAIDTSAFLRDGKLTSTEYAAVQEHTRIGAELVAPVHAALPLSPMVAHHHERWDGRGYPGRLRGKDIPLGARIIAVADLFEAKTTGRAYRRPLPYQRALADLQALTGTQLDPDAVAAFVRACQSWRRKTAPGRPVARCWEIRKVPASVCGACPNRVPDATAPCWENPAHLCDRHGEECATCLVYTEAISRGTLLEGAADGNRPLHGR